MTQSTITFTKDPQKGLFVQIDTPRLYIRSVQATQADYDRYAGLFGDPRVIANFAMGQLQSREQMESRISGLWAKRWRENDPYSGLAVFEKSSGDFVGHVILGHGKNPGEAVLAGLGARAYWGKGYGSEAAAAILQEYAPAIFEKGYLLDRKPLTTITAKAKPNDEASCHILEKTMQYVGDVEEYGVKWRKYSIALNELQKRASEKVSQYCCSAFFSQIFSMFERLYRSSISCCRSVLANIRCRP